MKLDIEGIETLATADRHQVLTTLGALFSGFAARDVDMLTGVYSDDADWVNAFGSVKRGNLEIVNYLRGLFADDNFNAGRLAAPPKSHLRRLTSDIATVSTHLQIQGQGLVGAARSSCATITLYGFSKSRPTPVGWSRRKCTWTFVKTRATPVIPRSSIS